MTIRTNLYDNSVRDNTGDKINGVEVDENPIRLANLLDGTTTGTGMNQVGSAFFSKTPYVSDHKGGRIEVFNNTGATFVEGTYVYPSDYNVTQSLVEISSAVVSSSGDATFYAAFVVDEDIGPTSAGYVCETKLITGVDTSGLVTGRPVFLGVTAGQWTGSLPAAPNRVQIIGKVVVVSATVGMIEAKLPGQIVPWTTAGDI